MHRLTASEGLLSDNGLNKLRSLKKSFKSQYLPAKDTFTDTTRLSDPKNMFAFSPSRNACRISLFVTIVSARKSNRRPTVTSAPVSVSVNDSTRSPKNVVLMLLVLKTSVIC